MRYRAALAERQFDRVDPDNRLVAAELERRWEETLRDLRQAEVLLATAGQDAGRVVPFVVDFDLQAAFAEVGRRLPDLWQLLRRRAHGVTLDVDDEDDDAGSGELH